jgi:hypothetical protein
MARFLPVQYILLLTLAYLKVFRMINLTLRDCKIFQSMHNVANAYRTPIMEFQRELYVESLLSKWELFDHTLQYLARRFGNWSVCAPPVMEQQLRRHLEPRLYDTISDMLTLETMQNCESACSPQKILFRF